MTEELGGSNIPLGEAHREKVRRATGKKARAIGKGQMGSALMGSLQISCFLTEGPFGYSR